MCLPESGKKLHAVMGEELEGVLWFAEVGQEACDVLAVMSEPG